MCQKPKLLTEYINFLRDHQCSSKATIIIRQIFVETRQKITAHIPVNLLHEAQVTTGKGITETIKIALSQLTHAGAYEALRKMRGKVSFSVDLEDLRKDR